MTILMFFFNRGFIVVFLYSFYGILMSLEWRPFLFLFLFEFFMLFYFYLISFFFLCDGDLSVIVTCLEYV